MRAASSSRIMPVLVLLLTLGLSFQSAQFAVLYNGMLEEPRFSFDDYIDGEADKPFAYRMLVPSVLRTLDAVTPPALDDTLDQVSAAVIVRPGDPRPIVSGPENRHPHAMLWLVIFDTACLFGYALIGASLFKAFFPDTKWGLIAPLVFVVLVRIVLNQRFSHIYDFATLLLAMSLLWAMARERHSLFLALFAVACVNKETAILATFGYAAVFFDRMPRPRFLAMLAAQVAIFAATYLLARTLFAENPGVGMEVWLAEQAVYFRSQPHEFFLAVGLNAFLVTYSWTEKPQILQRAAIMVIPNAALFISGGFPGEYRAFFEVYPVLCLLVFRNAELIARRWRNDARPEPAI